MSKYFSKDKLYGSVTISGTVEMDIFENYYYSKDSISLNDGNKTNITLETGSRRITLNCKYRYSTDSAVLSLDNNWSHHVDKNYYEMMILNDTSSLFEYLPETTNYTIIGNIQYHPQHGDSFVKRYYESVQIPTIKTTPIAPRIFVLPRYRRFNKFDNNSYVLIPERQHLKKHSTSSDKNVVVGGWVPDIQDEIVNPKPIFINTDFAKEDDYLYNTVTDDPYGELECDPEEMYRKTNYGLGYGSKHIRITENIRSSCKLPKDMTGTKTYNTDGLGDILRFEHMRILQHDGTVTITQTVNIDFDND